MKRIAWLPANLDACAMYRMFMQYMHTPNSIFMFHEVGVDMGPISTCDVAVVQRLCTQENYKALERIKQLGVKLVYDLDDNMWAIPTYNPAHAMMKKLEPGFRMCASLCDVVTVSTEPLRVAARQALGWKTRVEVMPNCIDLEWFRPVPEHLRKPKNEGEVVLGWAGTNTHTGDVEKIFAMLPALLEKFPKLRIELVGLPLPAELKNHPRARERDFVKIGQWPSRWASWQWDMSIAPLDENKFNNSKSNIKMLEAAAIGIPCVASDVAPYHDFCKTNKLLKENLLCTGPYSWQRKLEALIADAELRKTVGREMRRVAEDYDMRHSIARWEQLVEDL